MQLTRIWYTISLPYRSWIVDNLWFECGKLVDNS